MKVRVKLGAAEAYAKSKTARLDGELAETIEAFLRKNSGKVLEVEPRVGPKGIPAWFDPPGDEGMCLLPEDVEVLPDKVEVAP